MGNTNIKSENQSGGITAQNVNFASHNSPPQPPGKRRWGAKVWAFIIGLATIVATIVAVLTYFGWNHK